MQAIPGRIIDAIRDKSAPAVIRRKGAAGDLPVSVEEKIEILILLSQDSDEEIQNTAFSTLESWNPGDLQNIFRNPSTPVGVLDFAATYLSHKRKDFAEALLQNPSLPVDLHDLIEEALASFSAKTNGTPGSTPAATEPSIAPGDEVAATIIVLPPPVVAPSGAPGILDEEKKDPKKMTLLQKIGQMTPAEKIKTALTGNMEERLLLIRDSNKLVARAVLGSPKLTDQEIENIASMKNVTEEILRLIAMNRKFMRTYAVVRQLINNPRTPIDVGMSLLHRINDRDLKGLLLNKNIAEVVRGMALKTIKQKEEANKPKLPQK